MKKIFIDGGAGTTGLRILERLSARADIELVTLADEDRKNPVFRKKALNSCDVAILCLPDDAAREAVSMIENENVTVIDASTAHRTLDTWAYGFPELSAAHAQKIRKSKRIAVPGCHASGFLALVYPLIESGAISRDALICCHSVTGYSGGGKRMISEYENRGKDFLLEAPRHYALTQAHKHLPEMKKIANLSTAPIFSPIVSDFYSGMTVTVPLFAKQLEDGHDLDSVKNIFTAKYRGGVVKYTDGAEYGGFISANALHGKDSMAISVMGNADRIILAAAFDNLGKGASGAAVQCLNMVIGADPTSGLVL